MYACVYAPGHDDQRGAREARRENNPVQNSASSACSALNVVVAQFSPRYETRGDFVVVDVRGLDRLFGNARVVAEEMRREAADRGLRVHVAVAATQTAAVVMAIARPGVVVIEPGQESAAIGGVPIACLLKLDADSAICIEIFKRWGLRSLGDLAALPADELSARAGRHALAWQAMARGVDVRPLVPDVDAERFDASLDLEWPIEGLEPLSFVLTRLLEPLSLRLEQRDRGVAVLHVELRLVTKDIYARRLELPTPMRDVKTLRTLVLLDLDAHPPDGDAIAIDRVSVVIDPTPGRVWQHTLFARPHPTPEQLSTLLARLGAAIGQDRIGAPVLVDSYRPGAFATKPFATEHDDDQRRARKARRENFVQNSESSACSALNVVAARRCRQPVPARVAADANGQPVRVTTDRRGFAGGSVVRATGPWKTSGEWWFLGAGGAGGAGQAGRAGQAGWDRDEWDVALSDGASYRVFLDRTTNRWFIDAILD
jgi:protein ImuB